MPANMPKPSMLPASNRFQYAPSIIGTFQHLFVCHLLYPTDFQHPPPRPYFTFTCISQRPDMQGSSREYKLLWCMSAGTEVPATSSLLKHWLYIVSITSLGDLHSVYVWFCIASVLWFTFIVRSCRVSTAACETVTYAVSLVTVWPVTCFSVYNSNSSNVVLSAMYLIRVCSTVSSAQPVLWLFGLLPGWQFLTCIKHLFLYCLFLHAMWQSPQHSECSSVLSIRPPGPWHPIGQTNTWLV